MDKLQISDVVLYLPQNTNVLFKRHWGDYETLELNGFTLLNWMMLKNISMKLILYPLSAITDEDMKRMSNRLEYKMTFDGELFQIDDSKLSVNEIPYLCWEYLVEKGFDVKEFIERGLAVENKEERVFQN